ncbi:mCG148323, partial [Mus musculus]
MILVWISWSFPGGGVLGPSFWDLWSVVELLFYGLFIFVIMVWSLNGVYKWRQV